MKSLYPRMIIISFLVLLTFSCEDKLWDNPNDANTTLDPSEWAPKNLQSQVLSDSQIKLTWIQDKKLIEGFRIERQEDGASWTQVAEVVADVTQYTDTGLNTASNVYDYRIYAYTANNVSDYSNSASTSTGIIVTDIDGNTYQTVKIGDQWWMAENLRVTHYRNGEAIPNVTDSTDWTGLSTGAYCFYNNDANNATTYGSLYNWYAVIDSRNIAPEGWHVPSDVEWRTLVDYLGGSNVAGGKMKETGTTHWNSPNTGATNESGFSALPGGNRGAQYGYFDDLGNHAYFWSSSEYSSYHGWARALNYNNSEVSLYAGNKHSGFSVRCVKD